MDRMSAGGLIWLNGQGREQVCPTCGHAGATSQVLSAPDRLGRTTLLRCHNCSCAFFDPPPVADYADAPPGGQAALAFYLQQGAGLRSIALAVLSLDLPGPRRMLEVGCGYGFGLAVARDVLGWEVQGYDPSPFAAAGRAELGLPITLGYFHADHPGAECRDVVLCSEVLEHLVSPGDFLANLRQTLLPDGVLVLTTPNAEAVEPSTPDGLLLPLLSVGYHTVLQTRTSLEHLLRAAGFRLVEVEDRGPSLLAHASAREAAWHHPTARDDARYRTWLGNAGRAAKEGSDLQLGLLGRSYREEVSAGDAAAASHVLGLLDTLCEARYGAGLSAWPSVGPLPTALERLAERIPLSLGGLLLHRGYHRLLQGEARPSLEALFLDAARAAAALRAALHHIGADDGDAEDVAWTATAEAILCAAARGAEDIPARLLALGPAPGTQGTDERAASLARRIFVTLVNGGHYQVAKALDHVAQPALSRTEQAPGAVGDEELDVLYTASVIQANTPTGDLPLALRCLRALRSAAEGQLNERAGGSGAVLLWPAFELELACLERLGRAGDAALLRRRALQVLLALRHAPAPPADIAASIQ